MKIHRMSYNLYSRSIDISCFGCNPPYCEGCFNPELLCFNSSADEIAPQHVDDTLLEVFRDEAKYYTSYVERYIRYVFLIGGSWTHQKDYELYIPAIERLCRTYRKSLVLFAREELDEIPQYFKDHCNMIKTGKFDKELLVTNYYSNGINLATSNQKVNLKGEDY